MRKLTFGLLLTLGVLGFSFSTAHAAPLTETQIQSILSLLEAFGADVSAITNVENALRGQPTSDTAPQAFCYSFNNNFGVGATGEDVRALAQALQKEGIYGSATVSVFTEPLASAVVEFQEKYQSEILGPWNLTRGTGFVGGTTRAKLNALYGCDVVQTPAPSPAIPTPAPAPTPQTTPSITVLTLNGGGTLMSGLATIAWNSSDMPIGQLVNISLVGVDGAEHRLKSNTQNDGVEEVVLPDFEKSESFKFKIEAIVSDTSVVGLSDSYFTLVPLVSQPSITIISPNGGEVWTKDEIYNIAWNKDGAIESVTLWLADFRESSPTWHRISPDLKDLAIGKYSWKVGTCYGSICDFSSGDRYKVQVRESSSSPRYPLLVSDDSDSYFSIVAPATSP